MDNIKSNGNISLLFVFLLFPLYSLPYVIKKARECDKMGLALLVLFFATLAFCIVPNFDATNHGHWAYYTFQTNSYWYYRMESNDWFIAILGYLVLSSGLTFHYVIFFCVLFGGGAYWTLYYKMARKSTPNIQKLVFPTFFWIFPFISIMCGLRYYLAVTFFMLASYQLLVERKKTAGIISILIFSFIHFSLVVQFSTLIAALIFNIKSKKSFTFILVFILCSLSVSFVTYLTPYLGEYFAEDKIEQYTNVEYQDVLANQNFNFYISYYAKKMVLIPFALILIYKYYNILRNQTFFPIIWFGLMCWALGFGYTTLELRWGTIESYLVFLCVIMVFVKNPELIKLRTIKLITYTQAARVGLMWWDMKTYLADSTHLLYLLYMPLPFILANGYDIQTYEFIYNNHILPHK